MLLSAIQRFKIQQMALVPPIFIQMMSNYAECQKYDLSSVRFIFSGAAPLGKETTLDLNKHWPSWHICQGYGKTSASLTPNSWLTSQVSLKPRLS